MIRNSFAAGFGSARGCAVALALAVTLAGQAYASPPTGCRTDKLSNSDGMLISMASGLDYKGYPGSGPSLSTWLPLDKLIVCRTGGISVQITNLSERRQTVKALRIYTQNGGMP